MVFAKKVTSNGGFSVFFLDICHANDKLPTFKIYFKDEKKHSLHHVCLLLRSEHTGTLCPLRQVVSVCLPILCNFRFQKSR